MRYKLLRYSRMQDMRYKLSRQQQNADMRQQYEAAVKIQLSRKYEAVVRGPRYEVMITKIQSDEHKA